MLYNFADLHSLKQFIISSTRITESSGTIIDLLFVNNNHRIVDRGVIHCIICDHSLVYCTLKTGVPRAMPRLIEHHKS